MIKSNINVLRLILFCFQTGWDRTNLGRRRELISVRDLKAKKYTNMRTNFGGTNFGGTNFGGTNFDGLTSILPTGARSVNYTYPGSSKTKPDPVGPTKVCPNVFFHS